MNTPKLGETTTDRVHLGRRDAMHVACCLVHSVDPLAAGAAVRFLDEARSLVGPADASERQGIVDPFLVAFTFPGELFWVLLRPELVTNLHHDFEIGEPVGDESPFDEEDVSARDEEEPDERRFENSYVGRGRGDDDGCSGSWCDGH